MNTKLWVKDKGVVLGHFDVSLLQQTAADHWLHPLYLVSKDKRTWTEAINYENGLLWQCIDRPPPVTPAPRGHDQLWVKEGGRMLGPYSIMKLQTLAADNWLSKMHLVSEDRINWIFATHYKDGILWKSEIPSVDSRDAEKTEKNLKKTVKPPPENEWWYAQDRQPIGPMPLTQIRNLFGIGELFPNQLVWTTGMDDWKPAYEVTEFQRYVRCN